MELIKQIDCVEAIYKALRTPILEGTFTDTMSLAVSLTKEVPTIDAEPVKHGRWIYNPKDAIKMMFTLPKCSECGEESSDGGNYCSSCGAKMDEVK